VIGLPLDHRRVVGSIAFRVARRVIDSGITAPAPRGAGFDNTAQKAGWHA
jgi:hypothetical protein